MIYGAGSAGRAALAHVADDPSRRVIAFTDSDARKHDSLVEGLRIVAADSLTGGWFDEVVVASHAWPEIVERLRARPSVPASIMGYDAGAGTLAPAPGPSFARDGFLTWLQFANPGMLHPGNIASFDTAIGDLPGDAPIVEVGSFCGLSANLIQYLKLRHGRTNALYCADEWSESRGFPRGRSLGGHPFLAYGEYMDFVEESFKRHTRFFSPHDLPYAIRLSSDQFFERWRAGAGETDLFDRRVTLGGALSFAYIDGDHSYECARRDFEHVHEFLVPGGYVLFDDSGDDAPFDCRHAAAEAAGRRDYEVVSKSPNYLIRRKRP